MNATIRGALKIAAALAVILMGTAGFYGAFLYGTSVSGNPDNQAEEKSDDSPPAGSPADEAETISASDSDRPTNGSAADHGPTDSPLSDPAEVTTSTSARLSIPDTAKGPIKTNPSTSTPTSTTASTTTSTTASTPTPAPEPTDNTTEASPKTTPDSQPTTSVPTTAETS